ncbi:site-specific integrase [Geofilum rubicundum]|uniref:Putative integrase/recombinase n=1 Tax=Geofilum rubicundum JCM 15548 TaxID=1236989 RepID=A0A0E9LSR3_9BACT|nr:site-specific integrase [Geofilum rubicundum]GAO27865.1 putative integrase/recombinase [Geofilum rubicundum JCM 15548]
MEQKKQTIDELTEDFLRYLRSIRRSESTVRKYLLAWEKLKTYMAVHRKKIYTAKIGEAFLLSELGKYKFENLSVTKKNFVSKIEALDDYQNTGRVLLGIRRKPPRELHGVIGKSMMDFIDYKTTIYSLANATITYHKIYLHALNSFLREKRIRSVRRITSSEILQFAAGLNPHKPAARYVALSIFRGYMRYLFERELVSTDYSRKIPSDNYKRQPKLPSTFTKEEIEQFISSIDRGNPKGKRDYAMFLLALKLGFRSSDIANLKFENISWQTNEFNFEQKKTGKSVTLPILPEVGNAIIDYLKYGRPQSNENYCFLQILSPHDKIATHDIANSAQFYFKRANIDLRNRKHGPHALRHCFASSLLDQKTPLPVISEALGHSSTMSTMFYLRIDTLSLKQCALEVPSIPFSFYMQKGGCHE